MNETSQSLSAFSKNAADLLAPIQLAVGVSGGVEAAIHKVESANGRHLQHNNVNCKMATFAEQCGHRVEKEPSGFLDPATNKRPDRFIILNGGGQMITTCKASTFLPPNTSAKT